MQAQAGGLLELTGVVCSCACRDLPTDCRSLLSQAVLKWRLLVTQHSLLTDLSTARSYALADIQYLTV